MPEPWKPCLYFSSARTELPHGESARSPKKMSCRHVQTEPNKIQPDFHFQHMKGLFNPKPQTTKIGLRWQQPSTPSGSCSRGSSPWWLKPLQKWKFSMFRLMIFLKKWGPEMSNQMDFGILLLTLKWIEELLKWILHSFFGPQKAVWFLERTKINPRNYVILSEVGLSLASGNLCTAPRQTNICS